MDEKRKTERIRRNQPERKKKRDRGKRGQHAAPWSVDATRAKGYLGKPHYASLSEAPPELVERALIGKYAWIQRFVREGCPRGKLELYAREHAEAHGIPESDVPPYSTLNGWVKRVQAYGRVGLVDKARACRSRTVTEDHRNLIELSLLAEPGYTKALSFLTNNTRAEASLPGYHAVRREAKKIEREQAHLLALAHEGPLYFRNLYLTSLTQGILPGGYRLLIDSTVADQWVRIPDPSLPEGWEAVRPVLTVIQDWGTRMLVTFNLSLFAIDAGIILGTFGRAVCQSRNYAELYSTGLPYELALDKGSEHQGVFRRRVEALGIKIIDGKPATPQGQAPVERVIGTITTEVFARSTTGYSKVEKVLNPYAPPSDDVKRTLRQLKYEPYRSETPVFLLPTLEQLEARILGWATLYNERPHERLPVDSPEMVRTIEQARRLDRACREAA